MSELNENLWNCAFALAVQTALDQSLEVPSAGMQEIADIATKRADLTVQIWALNNEILPPGEHG